MREAWNSQLQPRNKGTSHEEGRCGRSGTTVHAHLTFLPLIYFFHPCGFPSETAVHGERKEQKCNWGRGNVMSRHIPVTGEWPQGLPQCILGHGKVITKLITNPL